MVSRLEELWLLEIHWFCEWLGNSANVEKLNFAIFHKVSLEMKFLFALNVTYFIILKMWEQIAMQKKKVWMLCSG